MTQNKLRAAFFILLAVVLATAQDAIIKAMSGSYPTWETVAFRGAVAIPVFIAWTILAKQKLYLANAPWGLITLRAAILFSAYMGFALSIATLPLANSVAIYFTMPFFVGALSGWTLGEKVPAHRWIAIVIGFCGVVISVRPGQETFQPAALLALYSALGYAVGQILSRKIAQSTDPIIIANMQSVFYFGGAVVLGIVVLVLDLQAADNTTFTALTRPFSWPTPPDLAVLVVMGIISALASVFFVRGYQAAPANFVAPFEYSAMIWAIIYGVTVFGDYPDAYTLTGAAIVIAAGLYMVWRDKVVSNNRIAAPALHSAQRKGGL